MTQTEIVNDLLSFVQNLDEEDATTFVKLYVRAYNKGAEEAGNETYSYADVCRELAEVDHRFEE